MPAKSVKKISKVGQGFAVFVTQECREIGWTDKDYVSVEIQGTGKETKLILKRIEV